MRNLPRASRLGARRTGGGSWQGVLHRDLRGRICGGTFAVGGLAGSSGYRRAIAFHVPGARAVHDGQLRCARGPESLVLSLVPDRGCSARVRLFTMYIPPLFPTLAPDDRRGLLLQHRRVAAAAGTSSSVSSRSGQLPLRRSCNRRRCSLPADRSRLSLAPDLSLVKQGGCCVAPPWTPSLRGVNPASARSCGFLLVRASIQNMSSRARAAWRFRVLIAGGQPPPSAAPSRHPLRRRPRSVSPSREVAREAGLDAVTVFGGKDVTATCS